MRKLMGCALAVGALIALPQVVLAQHARASSHPKQNEWGVDLGAAFGQYGSGCTTDCGTFSFGTPVDLRLGFPPG
jgi:hypothetical protein